MPLFKKTKTEISYDVLIDALETLIGHYEDWESNILNDGSSAPTNLVVFSQLHTFKSVSHLLSNFQELMNMVNELFLELRYYYDCLSQIYFIENGANYTDVIKYYSQVKGYQDESYKMLFENNPSLEELIGDVIYKHSVNDIQIVNDFYIQDVISEKIKGILKNEIFHNMVKSLKMDEDIFYHVHKLWHRFTVKGVGLGKEFYIDLTKHIYDNTLKINSDEILINFDWDNRIKFT